MKIAIPTLGKKGLEEVVSDHFGTCDTYTILDDQGNVIEIIDNSSSHKGGQGFPPELLKNNNIDVLICRGIGPRALELCSQLEVIVYVSSEKTVKDVFGKWKESSPSPATSKDICEDHRF
jgi:predicted Fe-Mo cluster-binding NifX family protein